MYMYLSIFNLHVSVYPFIYVYPQSSFPVYVYVFTLLFLSPCSDVDDIHDMMDDIEEQNVIAQEISDVLSTPFGANQDFDDVSLFLCTLELEKSFRKTVK